MFKNHGNGFAQTGQANNQAEDWEEETDGVTRHESFGFEVEADDASPSSGQEEPVSKDADGSHNGGHNDDEESVIIEVRSQDIRRIIGKGGSKIRELEQASNCKIKINKDRDDGTTAGVELVGSKDEQEAAEQMINDVITSSQNSKSQSGFGRSRNQDGFGRSKGGFQGDNDNEEMLEVEISSRDIARIIGRGGSKIRELQEQSSTRIHINKEKDNGATAVVEIRGSEEGQEIAKQLIEDLTKNQNFYGGGGYNAGRNEGSSRRGFGEWGRESLEMSVDSRDVSRIIGKGGCNIQEMQEISGTRIKINKDRDDGVTTVVEIRGSEEGQQKAKQLIEDLTSSQNSYASGNESFGRGRSDGEGRRGRGRFGGRNDWGGDSLEMAVSSSDVSRIIGRGGSKIQDMQERSGTRIKINKDRDDGTTTIVEIRGSEEGKQMAKELIEELTASNDSYSSGGFD